MASASSRGQLSRVFPAIKAFMVNQDGVVYEKDLGPGKASAVKTILKFNPDKAWRSLR